MSVTAPEQLLEHDTKYLTYAMIQDPTDPGLPMTFELNRTIKDGNLDIARQLLDSGAKWDANTIIYASSSFDAVKLLVEAGFDVNTGLIGGGALLP
jgi:hypothetical protein